MNEGRKTEELGKPAGKHAAVRPLAIKALSSSRISAEGRRVRRRRDRSHLKHIYCEGKRRIHPRYPPSGSSCCADITASSDMSFLEVQLLEFPLFPLANSFSSQTTMEREKRAMNVPAIRSGSTTRTLPLSPTYLHFS